MVYFLDSPVPSTSSQSENPEISKASKRPTRHRRCKFVGRSILHQWCIDDTTKEYKWYEGAVLDCVKGKDGQDGAVYEVKYKGEKDKYLVDHLQQDMDTGALKFIDV